MSSTIALIGGEEFADGFEEVHAQLAELASKDRQSQNGRALQVVFLPTCAAQDGPQVVEYWCDQARQRLGALGAEVAALPIVDRGSAEDPANARLIAAADWIYLGGGYPHVGLGILSGTRALDALYHTYRRGALISGASAGAMLLCDRSWVITPELDQSVTELFTQGADPDEWEIPIPPFTNCLGLVPGALCWPHLNQFFSMRWVERGMLPPGYTMLGVDEQTAIVSDDTTTWQVLGKGRAMVIDPNRQSRIYNAGQKFNK